MIRLPGLHLPSITGRAWADRGPLLLAAFVVALGTLLATAVPPLMLSTADDAVQDAVRRSGDDGAIVVSAPFDPTEDLFGNRVREDYSALLVNDSAAQAKMLLQPELAAALRPPVKTVKSPTLTVHGHGPGRTFQLAYVDGGNGAKVRWTAGGPPKSAVPEEEAGSAIRKPFDVWPVQVGISKETAAELKLTAGDRIDASDRQTRPIDVRISGVFEPLDPLDPAWQSAPQLLKPLVAADGTGTRIDLSGLMTAQSLPDGRLAIDQLEMTCTITFAPEPSRLGWSSSAHLAAEVVALKVSGGQQVGKPITWESRLDTVLREARTQAVAASAQASVLLVGLLVTVALVLLLAADLLVRRRVSSLAGARMRGASLAGIGAELVIEAVAVAALGAAVGMLLAATLADGLSWRWSLPVLLVAVLGGPVLGVRSAARATRGRKAPANRSARQTALRTRQLRRVAMEAAVALATAGAFVALRQRGVVPAGPEDGGELALPAFAPTLGAAAGALVLLRLLPPAMNLALRRATRSQRSLPLLAAARAAATGARPLPFLVLVMSSALVTFALAVATTESDGQAQGAWRTVGGDVRLDLAPDASVATLAQRISAANGVQQAVPARVTDSTTVVSDATVGYVRLVVVDAPAFQRLLATTPLPDAPGLSRLTAKGGPPPALLLTSDPDLRGGKQFTVRWDKENIPLTRVGTAPAVGSGEGDVLVIDAAAFAATGAEAPPNTIWATGPGAEAATTAALGSVDLVTRRDAVLAERRDAPLAAGLLNLAYASTAVLLLLGLLSVLLGAAASAPARGEMLARLRTLGLRSRESRRVAAGELLPTVVVGALGGLALGVLLAHASLGMLALRLLTGQATDPDLIVPWTTVVPVLALLLAVVLVVEVESSLRRRERLGQILRAGNV